MATKVDDVFSLTKEEDTVGVTGRIYIPKIISQGPAREWIERRHLTIRPWANFVDQKRFSRPQNLGEMCKRLVHNIEYFQSNYIFVFLGLIVYCVVREREAKEGPSSVTKCPWIHLQLSRGLSRCSDSCSVHWQPDPNLRPDQEFPSAPSAPPHISVPLQPVSSSLVRVL
ncbi:prenylated Rab acceptor protein 1 isoform X2 [Narcine bancroftii]|uniref:prenylated Rab acceptor protein 1 isoform X2 n=1 Tax=Narcine bancroftii TaxID=1343680 RepID=UPI0038319C3F